MFNNNIMKLKEYKICQRCKKEKEKNCFICEKNKLRNSCDTCRLKRRVKERKRPIKQPIKIRYSKKLKQLLNLIDSESDEEIICVFD